MQRNRISHLISIVDTPLGKIKNIHPNRTKPRNNELSKRTSPYVAGIAPFRSADSRVTNTIQSGTEECVKGSRQRGVFKAWSVKKKRRFGGLFAWNQRRITPLIEDETRPTIRKS